MAKLGLAYEDIAAVNPAAIYVSVSGFGATVPSPYDHWPALASVVEAMSGIYELKRVDDQPPMVAPVGGLGDLSAALFACIGVLAALRDRDRTGEGQYVDISMMDATVAMTDIVANFWSLGVKGGEALPIILTGFRACDGWFIVQVGREAHFAKLAEFIGHPEWATDPRFATRQGWLDNLEPVLRPAIEAWASSRTRLEAADALASAGIPSGPCFTDAEVVADPHLAARDMLVEMPRVDGVEQPVLTPGNPVRMSKVARGPETRVPWLGEHTDDVLSGELGLSADDLSALRARPAPSPESARPTADPRPARRSRARAAAPGPPRRGRRLAAPGSPPGPPPGRAWVGSPRAGRMADPTGLLPPMAHPGHSGPRHSGTPGLPSIAVTWVDPPPRRTRVTRRPSADGRPCPCGYTATLPR